MINLSEVKEATTEVTITIYVPDVLIDASETECSDFVNYDEALAYFDSQCREAIVELKKKLHKEED